MNSNKFFLFLNITIIVLVLIVGMAFAWTNPTGNPPSGGGVLYYSDGNIGIGTTTPSQKLSVVGTIESISGGFKFPDGTAQTSAAFGALKTEGGHTNIDCYNVAQGVIRGIGSSTYLCQISGSACPGGWTPLENWSTTEVKHCVIAGNVGCGCTTDSHDWSNTAAETCTYYSGGTKYGCTGALTCTAYIKSVGCY